MFLNGQDKDIKLSSVLSKEIRLPKLVETIINKIGRYGLIVKLLTIQPLLREVLIDESYVKIAEGHEKQVLYVEDKTAKFLGLTML